MTDQDERMTAKRKEETGLAENADLQDTEFAADTWTRAVFDTDQPAQRKGIEYDPYTHTERYTGELAGEEADLTGQPVNTEPGRLEVKDRLNSGDATTPVRDDDVETASEIAEPVRFNPVQSDDRKERERPENGTSGVGVTGLVLSILSLFLWPYLLGAAGIVLGFIAYRRDARTLGVWSMIIGAVAILGALIVYPYFTAR
jgi:hypothetical protein